MADPTTLIYDALWQYITYWQGDKQRPACGICGGNPVGQGCYHICENSVHYYSPEQERADDAWYGMDDERERYAATIESMRYEGEPYTQEEIANHVEAILPQLEAAMADCPFCDDDIPF